MRQAEVFRWKDRIKVSKIQTFNGKDIILLGKNLFFLNTRSDESTFLGFREIYYFLKLD